MDKCFKHYGADVWYDTMKDKHYTEYIRERKMPYLELPILDYTVIKYWMLRVSYAVIVPSDDLDDCLEHVYMIKDIPLDMSWKNLVDDINGQLRGEEPMKLPTKAKVICNEAEKICREHIIENTDPQDLFMMATCDFTPHDFRTALTSLGYTLEDIIKMNHHDVDEEFLREMSK